MGRTFAIHLANFVYKSSLILLFLVGLVYTVLVLQGYNTDTTRITNASFGITAILASLCFSCSRALDTEDKDRDRFTYAGERFMHASILLITTSVLKYALLTIKATGFAQAHTLLTAILTIPIGVSVAALFLQALLSAHTG